MDLFMDSTGPHNQGTESFGKIAKLKALSIEHLNGNEWDPNSITGHEPTVTDIPFEPGSFAAKQAFQKLWNYCHSPEAIAKAQASGVPGCENANGFYAGKPLIPGAGPGQGDMNLLVDKLKIIQGFDDLSAQKIAAAVKNKLAGG